MFCIVHFTQSARSRDNLEKLLFARLIRNNETLITGRTVRVIILKCAIKNWFALEDAQQAHGTYHACLLFLLQTNLKYSSRTIICLSWGCQMYVTLDAG
jgi:hypothetical protein